MLRKDKKIPKYELKDIYRMPSEGAITMRVLTTDGRNPDFHALIKLLDADLESRNGEEQKQYDVHNGVEDISDVIVVYDNEIPVACGAFKEFDPMTVELKRIFVVEHYRGRGLSKVILSELEKRAADKGYHYAVLETGIKQYEAIALYRKSGYATISNYAPYIGNPNSICMKKELVV